MGRFRWVLSLWSLALATPLPAQQVPADDPDAYFETVDVNVVNVEVFVTDGNGDPVTGLAEDDFQLSEDGRPITITNFYAVESGQPVESDTAAESAVTPGKSIQPSKGGEPMGLDAILEIPTDQRLHLVVYVDNFNIRPLNRNRVFSRLRQFLVEKLDTADRVMLVTYDRSLDVRHPFTEDAGAVARALFEVEKDSGHATQVDNERRQIMRVIEDAESLGQVSGRVRQYASSVDNDLRFTLDALRDMIDSLAGLPGRKALLYVSDGLPMIPGHELFWAAERKFEDISILAAAQQFNSNRRFQELAARANASRITFYTVDATGLQAYTSGLAEEGRTSSVDSLSLSVDSIRTTNLQASIRSLAERTGGRAIVNTNDVGPGLARVAEDFETYYSLGFDSTHGGDGKYHALEVKLTNAPRGYSIRHREGYRDKPVATRMIEGTLAALRYRSERNPLGIRLDLEAGVPHDEENFAVPVLVRIPLDQVVLLPRAQVHTARLSLFFSAMDEEGRTSEVQRAELPIEIPAADLDAALGKFFTYETSLLMRSGRHAVAVGVRDEIGARSAFVTNQILVGGARVSG
jgi:VWFA-related protein